jgi:hypothetical protein
MSNTDEFRALSDKISKIWESEDSPDCPKCKGSGKKDGEECKSCSGSGTMYVDGPDYDKEEYTTENKEVNESEGLVLDVGGIRITNDTGAGFLSLTTEDGYGVSIQPEDIEGVIEALQQALEEYSSVKPENQKRRKGEYYAKQQNRRSTDS